MQQTECCENLANLFIRSHPLQKYEELVHKMEIIIFVIMRNSGEVSYALHFFFSI